MFGAKNLLPCLATNYFQLPPYHSQFYHHTIPNFTIISKSTIHCLILLLSTTISHSTIYHLFATKTTILPYHSQLYHHIQVYHLLPFCYKKTTMLYYHSQLHQLPPILLSTRMLLQTTSTYYQIISNSTIYYLLLQMTTCYHCSN